MIRMMTMNRNGMTGLHVFSSSCAGEGGVDLVVGRRSDPRHILSTFFNSSPYMRTTMTMTMTMTTMTMTMTMTMSTMTMTMTTLGGMSAGEWELGAIQQPPTWWRVSAAIVFHYYHLHRCHHQRGCRIGCQIFRLFELLSHWVSQWRRALLEMLAHQYVFKWVFLPSHSLRDLIWKC